MTKTDRGTLTRTRTKGPALFYSDVRPDDARAVVGIVPGYADYADRYDRVQRAWAEQGVASIAIDLRGHGLAEGPRGACKHWDEYLDDASELFALLEKVGKPIFLFGHSFGGLVAASWVTRNGKAQRGVILSNPYMRVALPVPAAKKTAGRIVSALLPGVGLATGIKGSQLTHDEALAKKYDEDPLVFKKANARWFVESENAQHDVMARAKEITLPMLMVLGTADPVVAGGRELFDAAGSTDKKLDAREGLLHEVLNEPEWRSVADAIAEWVKARA
ncbi:MAG TPA: alpha/beta hydrolase [Polyangiaceae bacterium]|jgi:alpha-beta hydrolase superfamily lysophospholipase